MPSSKYVLFWFFSIQLLTKQTLNPEMTITYKFPAHKALFKVPKSATEYSCCSFPLRYLHVLTDILLSSSFRSKPRSVRGCYRHNTKSYSKKDSLKQVLSNLGVTKGIFNLFVFFSESVPYYFYLICYNT